MVMHDNQTEKQHRAVTFFPSQTRSHCKHQDIKRQYFEMTTVAKEITFLSWLHKLFLLRDLVYLWSLHVRQLNGFVCL